MSTTAKHEDLLPYLRAAVSATMDLTVSLSLPKKAGLANLALALRSLNDSVNVINKVAGARLAKSTSRE